MVHSNLIQPQINTMVQPHSNDPTTVWKMLWTATQEPPYNPHIVATSPPEIFADIAPIKSLLLSFPPTTSREAFMVCLRPPLVLELLYTLPQNLAGVARHAEVALEEFMVSAFFPHAVCSTKNV